MKFFKNNLILVALGLLSIVIILVSFSSSTTFGATILTTDSSDTLNTFRTNVNTSLTNLNTAVGAAITSINGSTSSTQTFATASSSDTYSIGTVGGVHTLTIPSNLGWFTNDAGFTTSAITSFNGLSSSTQSVAVASSTDTFSWGSSVDTHTLTIPSNIGWFDNDSGFITATSTPEQIQDVAGAMFTGNTETLITATYQDGDGTIDLVVEGDLSQYSNATSLFLTSVAYSDLTGYPADVITGGT